MNCNELMTELKSLASEKYKANVVKMGIPEKFSIGVSTGEVRKLAKKAGKSNELALELWNKGAGKFSEGGRQNTIDFFENTNGK